MKSWARAVLVLCAVVGNCRADAIHLKNGSTITADTVAEKDGQVEYTVGGKQYSVAKSSVSGIDHGAGFGLSIGTSQSGWIAPTSHATAVAPAGGAAAKVSRGQLAAALPHELPVRGVDTAALSSRIVNGSGVNERVLYDIEAEGNAAQSAAAYFIAARYAYDHSDSEAAQRYMKRCVEFEPAQAGLLEWYSAVLLDAGQDQEAVTQAQRAVQQSPHSAEALQILALAYYDSGRFAEAIENWKHAQELHPSETVANYLAKAEREAGVEGKFSEREGTHFLLRYEGRETGFQFASELLSDLDRQYIDLQRDLGFPPDITITVIIYTEKEFFDVTQAPSWADGLNDGKIRVPVRDLSGVTPRLEAVLRHEMAHSFVHALTHGRCPTWLNEGIAQMEEPRNASDFAVPLAQLFRDGRAAPLRYLEGSFTGLSPAQAQLAYAESLAATEYLRSNYGMLALRRMLELLNDGEAPEAALNHAVHVNYAELESAVGTYLANGAR